MPMMLEDILAIADRTERVDAFLAEETEFSRNRVQQWIRRRFCSGETGAVAVDEGKEEWPQMNTAGQTETRRAKLWRRGLEKVVFPAVRRKGSGDARLPAGEHSAVSSVARSLSL